MTYHFHIYRDQFAPEAHDFTDSAIAASLSCGIVVNGFTGEVIRTHGALATKRDEEEHRAENIKMLERLESKKIADKRSAELLADLKKGI